MVRNIMTLLPLLLAVLALAAAASAQHPQQHPQHLATPSTATLVNRGRGARRAFVGRGSGRARTPSTASSPFPTSASSAAVFSSPAPRQQQQLAFFAPTFAPTLAPTLPTFPATTFAHGPQDRELHFASPAPTPAVLVARRPSAALGFGPLPQPQRAPAQPKAQPFRQTQAFVGQGAGSPQRPKATSVPIVALKFNLRDDGSYSTSSETGDGTVRQEQGQFNGAAMAVQGMYAYHDSDNGPVQVNYVADEYGFQPQGPNIHPAIMQAVAEQVQAARSAKSRKGGQAINGILPDDDQGLDYDSDNGAGTLPPPVKQRARTVRKVVVRRPIF